MPCFYCGSSKLNCWKTPLSDYIFQYNGLDRIDSNKGHLISNVIPCCFICNKMKNNQTLVEYDKWISDIIRHSNL
jgi:hypothetical protein